MEETLTKSMHVIETSINTKIKDIETSRDESKDKRWSNKQKIKKLTNSVLVCDEQIIILNNNMKKLENFEKKRLKRLEGRIRMVNNFLEESHMPNSIDEYTAFGKHIVK